MYKYTHLIPENTAPYNAKTIGVYNAYGERVCGMQLNGLYPLKESDKQYSFLAISDVHITYDTANADFQRALIFAENSDCLFTCICGDLTSTGKENEMVAYKSIIDAYAPTKPVYAVAGNHENYSVNSESYLSNYTGHPLYYSFAQGDDVFIMLGHYGGYKGDGIGWLSSEFVTAAELQFLYETLEANRNKRCFVFNHVYPYEHGTGDADRLYNGRYWRTADGGVGQCFIELLQHYKNTILFHGHSHTRFALQELDRKANYSSADGYRSVHIPSLAVPRDLVDGALSNIYAESEGYVVDVFKDYIVLRGRDFVGNDADGHTIPIGTYKIDTKLVEVEANTFTDSTGTITT